MILTQRHEFVRGLPSLQAMGAGAILPLLWLAGATAALVLGGAVWLWSCYAPTVFFETIRAGLTACFG